MNHRKTLLAASIVVFGALITIAIHYLAAVSLPAAAGLFSGATTNTPSLAAAGQALRQFPDQSAETLKLPGLAYAVSYPFGIIGTILSMLLVKKLFRIDIPTERRALEETQRQNRQEIGRQALVVENPNLRGIEIRRIPGLSEAKAVISRVQRAGKTQVARPDTVLQPGDVVWLGIAQANRDPRKFPEPDRFNPDRKGVNQHIAFGAGPQRDGRNAHRRRHP